MTPSRGGLGRGLDALIPHEDGDLIEVDVESISPNPQQPRWDPVDSTLDELAASIREHGLLQPLIVSRSAGGYVLIAGERRWRAARMAGLRTVPVLVKEATPRERLEMALVENLQRRDLSPLEEATAYRQLMEEHGLTQEAVAARVGRSRPSVANRLRLLSLPPAARDALSRGEITEGHARALLACPSVADQLDLLQEIVLHGLSVRQAEELARRRAAAAPEPPAVALPPRVAAPPDRDVAWLEDQLRQALGTRVQLFRGRRGGKLVIYFYSEEELQGIYEAICGKEDARQG